MTVKAGQKCTAIRRAFVPAAAHRRRGGRAEGALRNRRRRSAPRRRQMGALVSTAQRDDVRAKIKELARDARHRRSAEVDKAMTREGAFMSPVLLRCDEPATSDRVHEVEAFGPVATLMPYRDIAEAIALVNRGKGSLVMSLFTYDHRRCRAGRDGRRRVSRPRRDHRPRLRQGIDRPRLAAARRSSMAGRAAPAAARKWAACAACCTTCSAPRCRAARACWRRSRATG